MISTRRRFPVLLLAAALLAPSPAAAGEPAAAPTGEAMTLAQTLFEEGRRLMEAKQYAEACPKFEESLRLRPGTGTLLNLALCNEGLGKTATAWAQFKEVLFAAKKEGNQAREAFAQEHVDAIEPKLSKLQVRAEATPGLAIRRDGQEIPAAAVGTPIPVDPGTHVIEATAPGYSVWSTMIEAGGAGELKIVAIPKLTPAPADGSAAAPAPDAAAPGEGSGRRTLGFVVGGVGVAALGAGAVLGLVAAGDASDAEDDPALCPGKRCTPAGREAIDSASTKALVSTIGIGVGVGAIAAGAILIFTSGPTAPAKEAAARRRGWASPAARVVPSVGPGAGGVSVIGAF
ncbi:MAG: hypothetical protein IT372_34240 [Polyangiaceae bacterium]|nr:hypothetical protein [Polyangiaceae bacterium]